MEEKHRVFQVFNSELPALLHAGELITANF